MRTDQEKVNLARLIKEAQEEWPAYLSFIQYKAKVCWARYSSLKREGFSHSDALMLCLKDIEL